MTLRKIERFFIGATLFCIPIGMGTVFSGVMSADLVMIQDLLLGCAYALWIYRSNLFSNEKLKFGAVAGPLFFMLFWSCLSMWSAIALKATGIGLYFIIKSFLLYFYLLNNIKTKDDLFFVVKMFVMSLLFQGVLGTMQGVFRRTFGLSLLGELQMSMVKLDARVRGTMAYPNRYGAVLILMLPVAISMAVFIKRSKYRWFFMAASAFGVVGLFFSLSRSSWAGFLLGMMVMTVLLMRRGMLKPKFVAAIASVLIGAAIISALNWEMIEQRFERGADGRHRSTMLALAFPIIRDNLIVGVGLNNYQWHSYADFHFWHPVHNEFLRLAAETGIPGGLMFVVLLFVFLREAYRNILIKDKMINAIAIGAFCGVIAFIVAINIGPEYQHYRIKLAFWALAGMTFALRGVKRAEIRTKKRQQEKSNSIASRAPDGSRPVPQPHAPTESQQIPQIQAELHPDPINHFPPRRRFDRP